MTMSMGTIHWYDDFTVPCPHTWEIIEGERVAHRLVEIERPRRLRQLVVLSRPGAEVPRPAAPFEHSPVRGPDYICPRHATTLVGRRIGADAKGYSSAEAK